MSRYLSGHHINHFIPMMVREVMDRDGKLRRVHKPVVHNLLFIQMTLREELLRDLLSVCPYQHYVYRSAGHAEQWCIISESDMKDLRQMCDSSFSQPEILSSQEYELKMGHPVRIVHGPMKGISGKLIRKNKKYYVVKSFDGFGVAVKVSRWCCEAMEEGGRSKE